MTSDELKNIEEASYETLPIILFQRVLLFFNGQQETVERPQRIAALFQTRELNLFVLSHEQNLAAAVCVRSKARQSNFFLPTDMKTILPFLNNNDRLSNFLFFA